MYILNFESHCFCCLSVDLRTKIAISFCANILGSEARGQRWAELLLTSLCDICICVGQTYPLGFDEVDFEKRMGVDCQNVILALVLL